MTSVQPPEEPQGQHARFQRRTFDSLDAVMAVAKMLIRSQLTVQIPGQRIAPTAAVHHDYSDEGDLFLVGYYDPDDLIRLEVKGISAQFTCLDDWPFKGEMFIDTKEKIDKIGDCVESFYTVSKDMKTAAIVNRRTRPQWFVKENVFNRLTGNLQTNYVVDPKLATFVRLVASH